MRREWRLGVVDGLGKIVVLGVEAFDDVAGELLITQWSTDRGQCIRQDLDFVEVGCGRGVQFLDVIKLAAKSHRVGGGGLGERILQSRPRIQGGGSEEAKAINPISEGTLDGGEDRLVLLHTHMMRRVNGRAVDGVYNLRRTRQGAIDIAKEGAAAEQR